MTGLLDPAFPGCPTEAGHPCGVCAACIEAQRADLLHGSPSDLTPQPDPSWSA